MDIALYITLYMLGQSVATSEVGVCVCVCVCVCGCAYKFHSQFHAVVANINIGKSPLSVYTIKTDSELKSCYGEGSTP